MKTKQLPLSGKIINKSNAIARAKWSAESVLELRLVALLASKIHTDDIDFKIYEIHVDEILKHKGGKDYREIEKVVDRIMSRVITIYDKNGNGWTKYNVFYRCRYRKKDGILELGFHPDLIPHYLQLQGKFLQYNKLEYLMLSSIYSKRMFEILKSWDDKPEITISLLDLHEMLNTPESLRIKFPDFRRRVLEHSQKELFKKIGFNFEWEPVKQGRAVVAIRFIFAKNRALPVAKVKEVAAQQKQSQANTKLWHTAQDCWNNKKNICTYQDNKKTVCGLCIRFMQKSPTKSG